MGKHPGSYPPEFRHKIMESGRRSVILSRQSPYCPFKTSPRLKKIKAFKHKGSYRLRAG